MSSNLADGEQLDALIVGAGFAGIYQLKLLLDQGMKVKVVDMASDVGGTWYWNRYPGAMSDTESFLYRYSWDREDLREYPWKRHYVQGPEVREYLKHVVERHGLRKHFQFKTELVGANWSDDKERWRVELSGEQVVWPRYLVTALGLLSKVNYPDIKGLSTFKGDLIHSARWPDDLDLSTKRVGIIGNGSTGVQIITAIAPKVKQLTCFQRTPQYSVPSGDRNVEPGYREDINKRYDEIWDQAKNSAFAFGFEESKVPTFSVSEEERERIFEDAWQRGNGFRFMFWTFSDIATDPAANEEAAKFIRKKIGQTIHDPEKARKLQPTDYYARRPLCDAGYYEQFNRPNVDIVNLRETPIEEITETGIKISDGTFHELDTIVFATGFDAVDGNYTRLAIHGRSGANLKEHWTSVGPTSYLGISVPDFPNMFMLCGPNGPFTNLPPTIETQVEFVSNAIKRADQHRNSAESDKAEKRGVIEAEPEAEEGWTELCDQLSSNSLFRKLDSWIFGANIPGKKFAVMFYFGGLSEYRKTLKDVVENGYKGFRPF